MTLKGSVITVVLFGAGVTALAFVPFVATPATAQVGTATARPQEHVLPDGGDSRGTANARLAAHIPDPVKYPVPCTKWDGKPDFSGVYWSSTWVPNAAAKTKGLEVLDSLTRPEAKAVRAKLDPEDSPGMHCWPESPANGAMHPGQDIQLVSAPGFLGVINIYGGNYRIIPTDGRAHDPSARRTFQGDAVGHWEGDTLVVDVTNFRERGIISLQFRDRWSDALHVVERWTRPDAQILEYQSVVEDPKTLTGPWTSPKIRRGRVSYEISQENFCIQDEWLQKINKEQTEASKKGVVSGYLQRFGK